MPRHDRHTPTGSIRITYENFTNYHSACMCGMCFNVMTWVESGPDEKAAATEIGDLLYHISLRKGEG